MSDYNENNQGGYDPQSSSQSFGQGTGGAPTPELHLLYNPQTQSLRRTIRVRRRSESRLRARRLHACSCSAAPASLTR